MREAYESASDSEAFWVGRLERYRRLPLPFALSPAASGKERWWASAWRNVEALSELEPAERAKHLLTLWSIYLTRITGETELQLGFAAELPASPLLQPMFASVAPLEVDIDLDRSFVELRGAVIEACDHLVEKRTYAQDLVVRYPQLRRIEDLRSLQPWDIAVAVVQGGAGQKASASTDANQALGRVMTLQIRARDGAVRWVYDAERLAPEQVGRMTGHLVELARAAVDGRNTDTPVGQLNVLPAPERELLVETWNATARPVPDATLPQLFEAQVARTPDAVALVFEDQALSYAELDARANRLAHHLIGLGVGPETTVAIALERSPELVVALLASLKAGAAYLPLDPDYPAERLGFMLADADPAALITAGPAAARLPDTAIPRLDLDDPALQAALAAASAAAPSDAERTRPLRPENLAYVIYTSGSTGRPKGVVVTQRNVVELVSDHRWRDHGQSRVLLHSPHTFDGCCQSNRNQSPIDAAIPRRANFRPQAIATRPMRPSDVRGRFVDQRDGVRN